MGTLKKYLPFIILGIVGIVILRMASKSKSTILPQTQLLETPYSDPNAQLRLPAFQSLAEIAGLQIQSERDIQLANINKDIARGEQVNIANIARGEQVNQFNLRMQELANQLRQFDILEILGLKSEETEIEKTKVQSELTKFLQESQLDFRRFQENNALRQFQLYLMERENDRRLQQGAIDRFYSSRNTGQIIGSISQALGGLFGNQGGSIFGTPPTFPSSGFGGFFGGF